MSRTLSYDCWCRALDLKTVVSADTGDDICTVPLTAESGTGTARRAICERTLFAGTERAALSILDRPVKSSGSSDEA